MAKKMLYPKQNNVNTNIDNNKEINETIQNNENTQTLNNNISNSTQNTSNNSNISNKENQAIENAVSEMEQEEKQVFNAQFTKYIGNVRSASQVKSLYERVIASNENNRYTVTMTINGTEVTATTIANLSPKGKFTVIMEDTVGNGIYDTITVITTDS